MTNFLARLILLTAILGITSASRAEVDPKPRYYISNQQVKLLCLTAGQSDEESRSIRGLCQTYVLGVVDGHEWAALLSPGPLRVFCLPEGTFNAQLTDAVIAWLKKNKVESNDPAAMSVFYALRDAFPCEGAQK